ncbi:MAG: carboxypeptidase regulatory-like domain-containing protein [bacterium]
MRDNHMFGFLLLSCMALSAIMSIHPAGLALGAGPLGSMEVEVRDFYSAAPLKGAGVAVFPNNYSGKTGKHGEINLEKVLPYRNYQVRAWLHEYTPREVGFVTVYANGTTRVVIPLKRAGAIYGRVKSFGRDSDFLTPPVREALVILGQAKGKEEVFQSIRAVRTDRRGNYHFPDIPEGQYSVVALKEGYGANQVRDIEVTAGKDSSCDFTLAFKPFAQDTPLHLVITDGPTEKPRHEPCSAPEKIYISARPGEMFREFYWIRDKQPAGSVPMGSDAYLGRPKGTIYSFTLPALGDYTISLMAIDREGTAQKASISFEAVNIAPEAVPAVIPGPSELPFIDSHIIHTTCGGSTCVFPGSTVYLRGFGIDRNLLLPQEFNPNAPLFDLYGNKNGNFRASLFGYNWTLQDTCGLDISHLLKPVPDSGNAFFQIPPEAKAGDLLKAVLTIYDEHGTASEPKVIPITVAETGEQEACASCHEEKALLFRNTAHATVADGAECQDCHGPGGEHIAGKGNPKLTISSWPGTCGQCHEQFAELQKANHSDPLPFGYYEPTDGRLVTCYRCHYTPGYIGAIESEKPFHEFRYEPETISEIPRDSPNVSCSVCHDPHRSEAGNPFGLRAGRAGSACDTCHYEKWQNAILEGMAGEVGNGYHYPGQDYSPFDGKVNPHRTDDKCVTCHLAGSSPERDDQEVRIIGGHTLRMRDFGRDRIPGTSDDVLNIRVCRKCHEGLETFDRNGLQAEIRGLLNELSSLLKEHNHGFLPANQPGNCARCHKGGTVPFLDDPDKILEKAYTNYKLILNDRSFGIHNPGYVRKLLSDSLDSLGLKGMDSR